MKVRNLNLKKLAVVQILIIGLLLTSLLYVWAQTGTTFTISQGIYPGAPSYTFWVEDSTYYVKDAYGVLAYYGTNCSYIIQTVIDNGPSGMHIYFNWGLYYLDSTISVTKNIRVTGEVFGAPWGSLYATTLKLTQNVTMFLWNHTENVFLGSFEYLTLDGSNMTETESVPWWQYNIGVANLIKMRGNVSDVTFDHVVFMNAGTEAISIMPIYGNIWNIWIQNCWIENNFGAGIGMISANNYRLERVIIRNNHFFDNNIDIHIADDGINHVIIVDNTSELTKQNFLRTTNSGRDLVVSHNTLYDGGCESSGSGSSAFWLNNTDHSIFSGNIINNLENDTAWEMGFYITQSNYLQMLNNQIYNITLDGIKIDDNSDSNLILGNMIQGNGGKGVYIANANCDYNTVVSTVTTGNTGINIHDVGTNTEIHSCWNGTSWIT